ncbi:MAG: dephospho-CoA kinase [Clostridia bacterium]|nr:dephospho-CoA kinase [Clostridia bacterium]
MLKIGVCGTSGSGKGYVCRIFEGYGLLHIDTDRVYREISATSKECLDELIAYFGEDILTNGALNTRILAGKVFEGENREERLSKLNSITHKFIKKDTEKIIKQSEEDGIPAVLIDAPVLFESGFDRLCDVTVCVTAPYEMKIERIIKRDSITREKAIARLSTQLSDEELRRLCTYEIDNTDGCDIKGQIITIMKELGLEA